MSDAGGTGSSGGGGAEGGAPGGTPGGIPGGFPGGFRVFTVGRTMGRDAASRFRVKPPWRARAGAGPLERALVGLLTFVLALPIALLLLAIGLLLLALFLGCAAVFVAFGVAVWLVRRVLGVGRAKPVGRGAPADGRENVRVITRQDRGG
jgi:hypothetical protein